MPPGCGPAPPSEVPGPQERVQRHTVELIEEFVPTVLSVCLLPCCTGASDRSSSSRSSVRGGGRSCSVGGRAARRWFDFKNFYGFGFTDEWNEHFQQLDVGQFCGFLNFSVLEARAGEMTEPQFLMCQLWLVMETVGGVGGGGGEGGRREEEGGGGRVAGMPGV